MHKPMDFGACRVNCHSPVYGIFSIEIISIASWPFTVDEKTQGNTFESGPDGACGDNCDTAILSST